MKKILVFGLVFFSFFMVFAACGDYYDQSCVDCYDCRTQYHEAPNKMTLAEAVKYCEKLGGGWSLANMCELRQRGYIAKSFHYQRLQHIRYVYHRDRRR